MTCEPNWFHGSCFTVALAYLARTKKAKTMFLLTFCGPIIILKYLPIGKCFESSSIFVQNPMAAYIAFKTADLREITLEYISRLVIYTKVCRNIYLAYTFSFFIK